MGKGGRRRRKLEAVVRKSSSSSESKKPSVEREADGVLNQQRKTRQKDIDTEPTDFETSTRSLREEGRPGVRERRGRKGDESTSED